MVVSVDARRGAEPTVSESPDDAELRALRSGRLLIGNHRRTPGERADHDGYASRVRRCSQTRTHTHRTR